MESAPKERRTWDWHLRTYFPIEPNSSVPLPMSVNASDAAPGHSYIERTLVANEGSGIHTESHVTSAECEKKCDIIGACRSFAYSAEQQICFLKDAVVTLEDASRVPQYLDYKTYIKAQLCSSHVCAEGTLLRPDAASVPGQVGETCCLARHSYTERTLVANEGVGVSAGSHATLAECEELCDLETTCRSFAYSSAQRMCYLKDAVVTLEDAARVPQHLDYKTHFQVPLCSNHVCTAGMVLLPNATSIPGGDDETCCEAS